MVVLITWYAECQTIVLLEAISKLIGDAESCTLILRCVPFCAAHLPRANCTARAPHALPKRTISILRWLLVWFDATKTSFININYWLLRHNSSTDSANSAYVPNKFRHTLTDYAVVIHIKWESNTLIRTCLYKLYETQLAIVRPIFSSILHKNTLSVLFYAAKLPRLIWPVKLAHYHRALADVLLFTYPQQPQTGRSVHITLNFTQAGLKPIS